MMSVGTLDMAFSVRTQGVDVCFDPINHQQVLSFQFVMSVPVPQILDQLMQYQRGNGGEPALLPVGPAEPAVMPSFSSGPARTTDRAPPPPPPPPPPMPRGAGATGAAGGAGSFQTGTSSWHYNPASQTGVNHQQSAGHYVQQRPPPPGAAAGSFAPAQDVAWQPWQPWQQPPAPMGHTMGPPQQFDGPPADVNSRLISSIRENDLTAARHLLVQKADVNRVENDRGWRTPLQHALEAGGDVDIVNVLLQANADVNLQMAGGKTACHYAIEQYKMVPPIVIRMLMCASADLNLADARNMTVLDSANLVARDAFASPGVPDQDIRVRQLLSEVTEQSTVAVCAVESSEVFNVVFVDTENDHIAFHTESALYLYSLKLQRVVFLKKLRQMACRTLVRDIAVNQELGTLAACLEIITNDAGGEWVHNVCVVWPNGTLTDEEPLRLNTPPCAAGAQPHTLPACVMLSRGRGPQMLACRFSNCEVYMWKLNAARNQPVHEFKLKGRVGRFAASEDGQWIAVENQEVAAMGGGAIDVWSSRSAETEVTAPKLVHSINRRPVALALAQQDAQTCCLALVERSDPGQPLPPIEVLSIGLSGASTTKYRVQLAATCLHLRFCHEDPSYLLSAHQDGQVIVYNLPDGVISLSHDGPGTRSLSISSDRTLLASAEQNWVRVYRVPPFEGAGSESARAVLRPTAA